MVRLLYAAISATVSALMLSVGGNAGAQQIFTPMPSPVIEYDPYTNKSIRIPTKFDASTIFTIAGLPPGLKGQYSDFSNDPEVITIYDLSKQITPTAQYTDFAYLRTPVSLAAAGDRGVFIVERSKRVANAGAVYYLNLEQRPGRKNLTRLARSKDIGDGYKEKHFGFVEYVNANSKSIGGYDRFFGFGANDIAVVHGEISVAGAFTYTHLHDYLSGTGTNYINAMKFEQRPANNYGNKYGRKVIPIIVGTGFKEISDLNVNKKQQYDFATSKSVFSVDPYGKIVYRKITNNQTFQSTEELGELAGFVADEDRNYFVLHEGERKIGRITAAGEYSVFAGTGGTFQKGGPRKQAGFADLNDIEIDGGGQIYLADYNSVRSIDTSGNVFTIAGQFGPGFKNGRAKEAWFNKVTSIAVGRYNIYVLDEGNKLIRMIFHRGYEISGQYAGDPCGGDFPIEVKAKFPNGREGKANFVIRVKGVCEMASRQQLDNMSKLKPERAREAVLEPQNKWTPWLNRDGPTGSGDYDKLADHLADGNACAAPLDVQCRDAASKKKSSDTGQRVICTKERGFICRNREQNGEQCKDYEVRFLCPITTKGAPNK